MGGKSGSQTTYTVDCILGLCEGTIAGVNQVFKNQGITTLAAEGLVEFAGVVGQPAWSYLVSNFPAKAVPYSGIAYLAAQSLQLGASGQLPNYGFEVEGIFANTACSDADPSLVVPDILSNPQYGSGFPATAIGTVNQVQETPTIPGSPYQVTVSEAATFLDNLSVSIGGTALTCVASSPGPNQYSQSNGTYTFNAAQSGQHATINYSWRSGLTQYQAFCIASGLWISPAYTEQSQASSVVSDIAKFTYSEFVWSQGVLQLIPRSIAAVAGSAYASACAGGNLPIQLTEQWSLVNKASDIAISNNQLTATLTDNGPSGATVIGTTQLPTPAAGSTLYFWANHIDTFAGTHNLTIFAHGSIAVGIMNGVGLFSPTEFIASLESNNSNGYDATGWVGRNPASFLMPQFTTSGIVDIAVRVFSGGTVSHVWYRFNGGLWNDSATADPVADIGGLVLGGQVYPALSFGPFAAAGAQVTANFGPIFVYPAPSGATILNAAMNFTPATTPAFNLGVDDFLPNSQGSSSGASSSSDPVIVTRERTADQINTVQIEWLDRNNLYAASIAEATDQALIDRYGRRFSGGQQAHLFCLAQAANVSAQLLLQKEYVRKKYSATLDERYSVLDPMDLNTLTEPAAYLNLELVRLTEFTEMDDGTIQCLFEEVPGGTGSPALYTFNVGTGFNINTNADPGPVNTPIIFVAPVTITGGDLEIWIDLSGAGQFWGGAVINRSEDGGTTYTNSNLTGKGESITVAIGEAAMGVTTTTLNAGPDPDTIDSVGVDLTESRGTITAASQADADALRALAYVGPNLGGGEVIAYTRATLTAANKYTLGTYLRRGVGNSPDVNHASGVAFGILDSHTVKIPFKASDIGSTWFFKFQSFNLWGADPQSLSAVTAYAFTITAPTDFTTFSAELDYESPLNYDWVNEGTISGFVERFDGTLHPDSSVGANALTNAQLFEQYVPSPVSNPSYTGTAILDLGATEVVNQSWVVTAVAGRGVVGAPALTLSLDKWLDGASDPNNFIATSGSTITARYMRGKLVMNTSVPSYVSRFGIKAAN